ncbi:hypothetical protein AB0953_28595 [Streptomyces sp. NPDC046866]|uniref:hypothetical protein n=1 Tax=Streptomyces sp. NPDC046866 TaxID=3154921 RepID=UPI003455D44B
MIVVLAWIFACALLYGLVKGGVVVFRAVRARAWRAPGLWAGGALMAGAATIGAYLAGAVAGWGGMDMGETCGEDQYDSAFVAAHQNDPLFPLHNWCNAEHDLVPSWVNPTVTGLAVLTAVCLALTAVAGAARITRTLAARRVRTAEETQQREQKA